MVYAEIMVLNPPPEVRQPLAMEALEGAFDSGLPSGGQCILEVSIFNSWNLLFAIRCRIGASFQIILSIARSFVCGGISSQRQFAGFTGSWHLTAAKQSGWLGITLAAAVMLIALLLQWVRNRSSIFLQDPRY